jgi:hypothetical protein
MNNKHKYFQYLNDLRESGETNMYGAGQYLMWEFGLSRQEAREILIEWMNSFKTKK